MVARSVLLLLLLIPASLRAQATDIQAFFDLLRPNPEMAAAAERVILDGWDDSQASMLVELHRFALSRARPRLIALLERATGQSFAQDIDEWWRWI